MVSGLGIEIGGAVQCCRALGEATRFDILRALARGERCVCELAGELDISQPLLSFHLRMLREAGLVRARREGRWMHYALDPDSLERGARTLQGLAASARATGAAAQRCC